MAVETTVRLTCALLLQFECTTDALKALLNIVLLLFHVLYGLVALCEQTLKAPDLCKKTAANLERKL
jgi:hypothetical protein